MVWSCSEESIAKLQDAIQKNMGDQYEVRVPRMRNRALQILNLYKCKHVYL